MFIFVRHGDNEDLLVNPNCTIKNLSDYITSKCHLPKDSIIDLTDGNSVMTNMHSKETTEYASQLFKNRNVYLLCTVELNTDKSVKKITPRLQEWEKQYPLLERKIRFSDLKMNAQETDNRTAGAAKADNNQASSSIAKKKSVGKKKKK